MAASNQAHYFFMVDLKGKAHYQRGHGAQDSGFKLATCSSTFVLFILDADLYNHINKHSIVTTSYVGRSSCKAKEHLKLK